MMENGSGSPCINLASVPCNLVAHLEENHCDLIVLEGMGRAIHTNLHAKFNIGKFLKLRVHHTIFPDCLKLAVLKNAWIAQKLNGKLFDVVCKMD